MVADSELLAATSNYLLDRRRQALPPHAGPAGRLLRRPRRDPRLITGSVSIELVHLATLYHDDVIDEADSRRGIPSVNVRWDNTVAILTGDYLFARASEISADLGPDVCRLLARTIAVLCDGQIREVDSAGKTEQTEENYLEIIRRKTGSLIAHLLPAGRDDVGRARRARGDPRATFGESLGMAFQLSDDIMDITSTPARTGQGAGSGHEGGCVHPSGAARPRTLALTARSWPGSCLTALPTARCWIELWRSFGAAAPSSTPGLPWPPR